MRKYFLGFFAGLLSIGVITQSTLGAKLENRDAIAVIIANSEYRNEIPPVDYAGNDGDAMRSFLIYVLGYRDGNIIDLRNAGQAEILAVFGNERSHEGKLWSWVRPGRSDVFVYYSGHGAPGARDKRGYLLPVDSDPATVEINGYPLDLLYRNLAKLKARSVTVMLDACFSGASEGGMLIKAASPVFVKTVASEVAKGITVLSAARGDQLASWDREAKLGLFTSFALKGLYGEADKDRWGNGDGKVTLAEVRAYLDDEMSYAARRRFKRVQHASAVGDPKTVMVAEIPPETVASLPAKPISVDESKLPRGDLLRGKNYLNGNRANIGQEIRKFYNKDLVRKDWDVEIGRNGRRISATAMKEIKGIELDRVEGDIMFLRVWYNWIGDDFAERATWLSTSVWADPDRVTVIRAWR